MEHKNLMEDVDKLIKNELEYARSKFSNLNSSHEGYAVILEEFEELKEEMEDFDKTLQELWKEVRSNDNKQQADHIISMEEVTKKIIKETVQLGAMCRRFNEDLLNK